MTPENTCPAKGWISLHRQVVNNPMWLAEKFTTAQAWIDLLFYASFEQREIVVPKGRLTLEKGQLATTFSHLAERWKWSKSRIARTFQKWVLERQIEKETEQGITLITICNYETFQCREKVPESVPIARSANTPKPVPRNAERNASEDDNNNINKYKNKKTPGARTPAPSRSEPEKTDDERSTILDQAFVGKSNDGRYSPEQWPDVMVGQFGFTPESANAKGTVQTYNRWALFSICELDVGYALDNWKQRYEQMPETPVAMEKIVMRSQQMRLRDLHGAGA